MVDAKPVESRTSTGVASIPTDGATSCIAANWPLPEVMDGSQRTAARVALGTICFRSSSHFALVPYSNKVNPVILAPGRARLATYPLLTGSVTLTKTIGTALVAFFTVARADPLLTKSTSGAALTNSVVNLRTRLGSPPLHR